MTFNQGLWIVRKRVLAALAVFLGAGAIAVLTGWYASHAKGDPGPVVYVFVPVLVVAVGIVPTLWYLLPRWAAKLQATNCPLCGEYLWTGIMDSIMVALFGSCTHCYKSLKAPAGK